MSEVQLGSAPGAGQGNEDRSKRRRRSWVTWVPIAVVALLIVVFGIALTSGRNPAIVPSALINDPAPQFSLPPLDGLMANGQQVPGFDTASFTGQITVVNVWASWCLPCRGEHPFVEQLAQDPRIRVVGLNHKDIPANAISFLQRYGDPYAAIGQDPSGRTSIDWGVYGVPETFLVDRNGVIRYKLVGPMDSDNYASQLLPQIEALLTEQPGTPTAAAPVTNPPA